MEIVFIIILKVIFNDFQLSLNLKTSPADFFFLLLIFYQLMHNERPS